jgi:hypothetical protein
MTAKEIVRLKYPNASIERQVEGRIKGMQKVYFLVRKTPYSMTYLASGNSKSNAWVNAKKFIQSEENEPQP